MARQLNEIASADESGYEFVYWGKVRLGDSVGLITISQESELNDASWGELVNDFLTKVWPRLETTYIPYVFLTSPYWMPDTKINRYYGLWKRLTKNGFNLEGLKILSETSHQNDNKIIFSGIARLDTQEAFGNITDYLLRYPVGILFAFEKADTDFLNDIERKLFDVAVDRPQNKKLYRLEVPKAIAFLNEHQGVVIFEHGSEDYGGIYLDVFIGKQPGIDHGFFSQ